MKKVGFFLICLLVFAGTLLIFSPGETSAAPWLCFEYPIEDCREEEGYPGVSSCIFEECNYVGPSYKFCIFCRRD